MASKNLRVTCSNIQICIETRKLQCSSQIAELRNDDLRVRVGLGGGGARAKVGSDYFLALKGDRFV